MQTFLPYPSFSLTAACLDYRRLGKQRVEAFQVLCGCLDPNYRWANHPAVKMWKGCELTLCDYGIEICKEWIHRGYKDTMLQRFLLLKPFLVGIAKPAWLGDGSFHSRHRAALLAKDFEYYRKFNWVEKPGIDYIWPFT